MRNGGKLEAEKDENAWVDLSLQKYVVLKQTLPP